MRTLTVCIATALVASAITAVADVSPTAFWQSQMAPVARKAMDITAPGYNRQREAIRQATIRAADRHGIPREFHLALTKRESGFRFVRGPATRYGYAYGPHQILCATAREMGEHDCSVLMRDADRSAELSARYIKQGYNETGSWKGAAAYYHGGPNKRIHGRKTAAYANAVGGSVDRGYASSKPSQFSGFLAYAPVNETVFSSSAVPSSFSRLK